jgi:hypothetical protein
MDGPFYKRFRGCIKESLAENRRGANMIEACKTGKWTIALPPSASTAENRGK